MNDWVPPLVSGLFSIVVVVVGAYLVERSKRRDRSEDLEKESKDRQREALARFLRADRELSTKLSTGVDEIADRSHRGPLSGRQRIELTLARVKYFNELLAELEVLELNIHDKFVERDFRPLDKVVRRKLSELYSLAEPSDSPPGARLHRLDEKLQQGISDDELNTARNRLRETARTRLRVASKSDDQVPGMYTPPHGS